MSFLSFVVSGHKHKNIWARIGQTKILESKKQKLPGVEIDSSLNFDLNASSLCKKAGKKLSVLARLSNSKANINENVLDETGLDISW